MENFEHKNQKIGIISNDDGWTDFKSESFGSNKVKQQAQI